MAYTVDLSPVYATLNQVLVLFLTGLITAIAGALGVWLRAHLKFLSVQQDAAITTAFNTALQNGANIALNSLHDYEGTHSTVAVQSWVAEKAAQYAIDHNQDFVKRFTGKSPDQLTDDALAMIQNKALAYVPPVAVNDGTVTVHGQQVTLGKPTPAGVSADDLTKAFNPVKP